MHRSGRSVAIDFRNFFCGHSVMAAVRRVHHALPDSRSHSDSLSVGTRMKRLPANQPLRFFGDGNCVGKHRDDLLHCHSVSVNRSRDEPSVERQFAMPSNLLKSQTRELR